MPRPSREEYATPAEFERALIDWLLARDPVTWSLSEKLMINELSAQADGTCCD